MIPEEDMRASLTEILEDDEHYFTADWTPELAVESAVEAILTYIRDVAAPLLLSHERQLTADAHRDAIVNRDTVEKLQAKLDKIQEHIHGDNWFGGEPPCQLRRVQAIIDEDTLA